MCNLYRLQVNRSELLGYYNALDGWRHETDDGELPKDYVSKSSPGLIVRLIDGQRELSAPMHWGWWNPRGDDEIRNVRNHTGDFWRPAIANPARRCLVPFTSFQEWTVEPDPTTGKKRPHFFSIPSRPIGTFAGVRQPTGRGDIFAFLTCGYSANGEKDAETLAASTHIVGAIHPKAIPVILEDEDFDRWLKAPIEDALSLACAFPSQLLAID